jgi:hypothetical protein
MSFYDTINLPNFSTFNPQSEVKKDINLIKSSIHQTPGKAIYDSTTSLTYSAGDLLQGYIIRRGLNGSGLVIDSFDTASNIIAAVQERCLSIHNLETIPNGTSFECILFNDNNGYDNTNYSLGFYSSSDLSLRVGGYINNGQIAGGATAVLKIVINDQASLGDGHSDQVWVCISRCSTGISIPCFLAGSMIAIADGSFKAIELVQIGDQVIGAFGEINTVLALHQPLLGEFTMLNINNDHATSSHHPHISTDKQFYCLHPSDASTKTYGRKHSVITADGSVESWMLHGLRAERIKKIELGVELKTIDGSKPVTYLEEYSMPPTTQLYNLVISGSHTYHVNGYAVTGWPREDDFCYDSWTVKESQ